MPKKTKTQGTARRRTKVDNLPAKGKKLSKGEQKNVKGGLIGLLKPDQAIQVSNSQITDGTSNAALLPAVFPTDQKR
jgi:hypothetical protein